MRDKDDFDSSRPRPRKKVRKRAARSATRWIALLVGCALAGLLAVGLLTWGVVRVFTGGGPFGPVVAQARPADTKLVTPIPPPPQVPSASPGWQVTPDGLPLASGLTSAVPLPDGDVNQVVFSDPARAQAAVVFAKGPLPPGPKVVVNNNPTYPLEWAQVDLRGGRVVAQIPVGNSQPGGGPVKGFQVSKAALSPAGERLAVVVPAGRTTLLQVWDKTGLKLMELNSKEFPGQPKDLPPHLMPGREWLEFLSESRLLVLASGALIAVDVPSGTVAYTLSEVKAPVALSPGRKWVCAAAATDGLKFFNTADGTPAGEIPKYGKPTTAAFSPDGAALAGSFGSHFAIWDVATGKPTGSWPVPAHVARFRVDRPSPSITWFGGDYLLSGNLLLDRGRGTLLCEYNPGGLSVAWSSSPDGRLWATGNFKDFLAAGVRDRKVTPGPIADAGLKGTNLMAACSVTPAAVKDRLQAALSGITFRPDDPVRIEVTGSGSTQAKQLLADAAAEELAKRGKAVDPSAKVGVRIELSRAKREQITKSMTVQFIGQPPPGELRDVYRIEASVYLINLENGSKSKAPSVVSLYIGVTESDWETTLCKGIGSRIGMGNIPLAGSYTAEGAENALPVEAGLGIDGVLP
jgi:hypothetical protein